MFGAEAGRDIVLDGSLFGMGRGAGNAKTELLADFLNKRFSTAYDIAVLLDVIEKYIVPLKQNIHWGYDLPMFVCGCEHAHVDNVFHLQAKYKISAKDMYAIIGSMTHEARTRYGTGYPKADLTLLEQAKEAFFKL